MKKWLYRSGFILLVVLAGVATSFSATKPQQAHAAAVSGFVTRSGSHLLLNGNTFRASGPNSFWWGIDDFPVTQYRVNDALTTAQEMGATIVRVQTLGMSQGCVMCIEPTLGNFSESALKRDDYAIAQAGARGLRLIIPFIDNYSNTALGGKFTFTGWRGLTNENDFYTNTQVISDFEQYISTLLNRVNTYTGVAYKDDPTILGWETGNEIYPPVSWTRTIADYIKSVDSHHLVIDGYRGVSTDDLGVDSIDIIDDHEYPMSVGYTNNDAQTVANAGKAYYIGEYDWANHDSGGDTLSDFISNLESNTNISIDTYWHLYSHDDGYGYRHTGGYDLVYPGENDDRRGRAQQLRAHAYKLQGVTTLPADSLPAAPVITSVVGNQVAWQGAVLAGNYSVERSTTGADGSWNVVCDQCATDFQTPWTDSTQPTSATLYYRVRGYNRVNQAGPYSRVFQTTPNLVAGATPSASSSVENTSYGWGLQFANDGQRSSTVNSSLGWISSNNTGSDHNEWLAFNLGSAKTIGNVVLYPRNDSGYVGTDFPTNFEIDVSTNGSGWTPVLTENSYPAPTTATPQVFSFAAQKVQYVRVYANSLPGNDGNTYRMAFAEVEVYAPTNRALQASPTASSSFEDSSYGWGIHFVNDGQRTSTVDSSLGWISSDNTGSSHTETLTLNVGNSKSIGEVDLYPRNDSGHVGQDFPVDFTIDVSTDGINWTNVATQTNYATPTSGTVQSFTFSAQTASFIRVQGTKLPGDDGGTYRMAFAEVEVS